MNKKFILILLVIFLFCLKGMAISMTEGELIVTTGITVFPFYGEPKHIIKCYWDNNKKICRETYSDEDIRFYRSILEKVGLLKPGEKATYMLLQKRLDEGTQAYEKQQGICPVCKKHFDIKEMEGDHITPWCEGGKTNIENCQMLCKECNRRKSDK